MGVSARAIGRGGATFMRPDAADAALDCRVPLGQCSCPSIARRQLLSFSGLELLSFDRQRAIAALNHEHLEGVVTGQVVTLAQQNGCSLAIWCRDRRLGLDLGGSDHRYTAAVERYFDVLADRNDEFHVGDLTAESFTYLELHVCWCPFRSFVLPALLVNENGPLS